MTSFLLSKKLNVIHRCLFLAFDDFARISLSHKFVLPLAGPAMLGAFFRWLEAWLNSRMMHEFAQAPGRIKIKDWEAGLFALLSSLTILPYQPLKWILRGGNTHQALSQVLWDFGTGFHEVLKVLFIDLFEEQSPAKSVGLFYFCWFFPFERK